MALLLLGSDEDIVEAGILGTQAKGRGHGDKKKTVAQGSASFFYNNSLLQGLIEDAMETTLIPPRTVPTSQNLHKSAWTPPPENLTTS